MNKLSIIVFVAVAICSCYGISDRRTIRSASEISAPVNPDHLTPNAAAPQDSVAEESNYVFTARGKKNGNKHKMEIMHMGLTYVKMVINTLMGIIGHLFAFKSVGIALISLFIQIAQFVMALKKNKESHPTPYKVVETPWHTAPTESYGSYGGYAKSGGGYASPYNGQSSSATRRRR